MTDSVESGSEKVNNEILSRLANDDYLLNKVISMRQRRKLTKSDINYIVKNAQQDFESDNITDIDDIVNQAVNNIILECEENLYKEVCETAREESADFIEKILNTDINIRNFENIFCLKEFKAIEFPQAEDDNIRNIRYKDYDGITHAIAQINTDTNKIRLQTFSDVFPKQEFINPQQANYRVMSKSKTNNWTTEYGGINQFDGSIEIRYKDVNEKVMAAVIFKSDGNIHASG